ncbi:iron ABC transporter permease [Corynebacterium atypicum]|uniref:Iron ABC transporter permease n=1 Tax=Corynebacterium atypicum TaxID=191610 RepID=A0ABM5QM81_9CORY|nr:iron ABC transporter permease [Corynebacterium atypicum]AIG63839.1 iron ABC transporter permease [Corynebacterium atypicum]
MRSRLGAAWTVGLVILLATCAISLFAGAASLSGAEVWATLAHRLHLPSAQSWPEPSPLRQSILLQLRVPRILMAVCVGAALAVAGVALQATTRNDLAEPYLLGISSGASAGAVITITLGIGGMALTLSAGAGIGALVSFGVLMLLLRGSRLESTRVVLTGVLVGQFFSAIMSMTLMIVGNAEQAQGIMFWLLGALGAARWNTLGVVAAATVAALVIIGSLSRYLDAMSFGDATARTMGVPVTAVRTTVLIVVSLLTAATVSAVGAIGFIGLIVPHAVRMVVGSQHSRVIPLSALVGAIFLVAADAVARVAFAPEELSVGVVTALVGVPVFFAILHRRGKL